MDVCVCSERRSFVLGVQSRHLRSTKLSDLVFRADGAVPSSRRAMVKVCSCYPVTCRGGGAEGEGGWGLTMRLDF